MLTTLRQRNFALLWIGQVISVSGDWVLFIGLPFYVYQLTHSALATGAMFIASSIPRVLLGSVAGVFVDRWDRKRTMIAADVLRAALLPALLLVRSENELWIIYLVAFVEAGISQFFVPAVNALLPRLVDEGQLMPANSLNSLGQNIARLVAPSLGGLLLAWLGLYSTVLFDSASFVISALLLAVMSVPAAREAPAGAPPAAVASVWSSFAREYGEGLRVVRASRLVSALFAVFALVALADGLISVLFVPFVQAVLHGDAVVLGSMMSAQAAGSLAGGAAIGWVGKRVSPARLIVLGALGWGVFDLAIVNSTWLPLIFALFVLVGIPIVGASVSGQVMLQSSVADQFRGRVFGALGAVMSLFSLAGLAAGGVLGDRVGIVPMLNAACGVILLTTLTAAVRLREDRAAAEQAPTAS